MKPLQGKPISPGYASGIAVLLEPSAEVVPRRSIPRSQVQAEIERLMQALNRSRDELDEIRRRVLRELGKSHSGIFEAHLAILHDARFVDGLKRRIERELVNAEQALDSEIAEIADDLARAGDPYLRDRQQDFRDLRRRVLGHLINVPIATSSDLPPRSVLVARELLPSDTLNVDRRHLAAVVTEEGGETSHAAILARALGVPAVTGVERLLQHVRTGMELLVDGEAGRIVISPSTAEFSSFAAEAKHWKQEHRRSIAEEGLPCATLDGFSVSLLANVARPEEASQVIVHRLDGIGLLRTEFLFLDAIEPPSVDFQYDVYRQIAEAVAGKPVVLRTLDMAGDKRPVFLNPEFDHPLLSFRGLRFSLKECRLFVSQIAAALRAAKRYDIRLLLPMVVERQDVARAVDLIRDGAAKEGLSRSPPIGVMIETPAAVVLFDELSTVADFVSIGTNDLVQYMLAADRQSVDIDDDYSIFHPAVLRPLRDLIARSADANLPISICGEAAGDSRSACLLAGMGIRQLSMSPVRAARVRHVLRGNRMADLSDIARQALHCGTTAEVRELLDQEIDLLTAKFAGDVPSRDEGSVGSDVGLRSSPPGR